MYEGRTVNYCLCYVKPFKPVTKATISRWVKMVLKQAGIDVGMYAAHSSRAAATSHAKRQGLNLQEIMKSAGWTPASTFGEVVLNNIA